MWNFPKHSSTSVWRWWLRWEWDWICHERRSFGLCESKSKVVISESGNDAPTVVILRAIQHRGCSCRDNTCLTQIYIVLSSFLQPLMVKPMCVLHWRRRSTASSRAFVLTNPIDSLKDHSAHRDYISSSLSSWWCNPFQPYLKNPRFLMMMLPLLQMMIKITGYSDYAVLRPGQHVHWSATSFCQFPEGNSKIFPKAPPNTFGSTKGVEQILYWQKIGNIGFVWHFQVFKHHPYIWNNAQKISDSWSICFWFQ